MQIYNWKHTTIFTSLLDWIPSHDEDCVIILEKKTIPGWFHVSLIKHLYPFRKIFFITRDDRAKKLFRKFWYKTYNSLQDIGKFLPEWFEIISENIGIYQYMHFHITRFLHKFFYFVLQLKPRNIWIFEIKHSSWYVLILGIIIILLLMVGIISLTSPHASIIITPQTNIQNAMKNIVFVSQNQLQWPIEQIPLQKDIFTFDFKKTYTINTFDPKTLARAQWIVRIQNFTKEKLRFLPQTRLSGEGSIFRIEKSIEIPPATDSGPGETLTSVIADPLGNDGVIIGSKWNLPQNTPLVFPWLNQQEHEGVMVFVYKDFTGGEDSYIPLLTQSEYDRIKKIFIEQVIREAQTYKLKNYDKKADFIPLPIPDAFEILDMHISSDVQPGWNISEITFSTKANFMIYLYHQSSLRKTLLQTAKSHLLENTESLIEISDSPPDIIATLSKQDTPFSIKATAQIPVQILYDFSSKTGQKTLTEYPCLTCLTQMSDRAQEDTPQPPLH
jgi:hypothetical protein